MPVWRLCGRVIPGRHIRCEMSDVATLLAEADWLTRLARSLVGSDDADDIVQETYAAALRSPPDPDRPARPWLRRVMVNVVRMRHRGRVRRDAREQAAIAAEIPTPEQALERARTSGRLRAPCSPRRGGSSALRARCSREGESRSVRTARRFRSALCKRAPPGGRPSDWCDERTEPWLLSSPGSRDR